MRRGLCGILALAGLVLFRTAAWSYELNLPADTPAEVYYSPCGGAQAALLRHIGAARQSIHVLAYLFTNRRIAHALGRAARRGVDVEVILDVSQRTMHGGQGKTLAARGVRVFVDSRHATAHNKVMIFDGTTVATGSYNFTISAERSNAENLLFLDSPALAALYEEDWQRHRAHSDPW